ncbi:sigma 54-interacting transcriptional regulator [Rhodomicrobium lacus]|uniref:sigma 54-interacting transcriptional regulator n=1 Tax=Rhodomicrobium lacus TaxID=2498452 RepID=UPI000F8DE11E|nr:sigma 54-interacting transcriptional regulator [Rhodomicrobium lacus]
MDDTLVLDLDMGSPVDDFTHCFTGECRANVLPILYRLNRAISSAQDLSEPLRIILDVMRETLRMHRGAITLYDRQSETIFIHDSFGLTDEQKQRGIYSLGEGITGKVVESGKLIVVPRLHESTDFLDRTKAHQDRKHPKATFFCVPILLGQRVLGTIGAERVYLNPHLFKQDAEFLAAIALMIAPAVELYLIANNEKVRLENENRRLKNALKERYKPKNIIGNSKPMIDEVYNLIGKVASTRATVLILGESGVGKELVANAIHYNSASADGPFVKFNCAAIPEALAESELFGHEKGSFTGALQTHKGSFEQADGGTIFLDEVGELSLTVQAKLLRVLQDRTVERVGSGKSIKVDLRIIAATNRNLPEMVENGLFREDLFYRLNVVPITVPPLRERGSDVILLADYFVAKSCEANGRSVKRISTPALNMLMAYHWPGNVRELENVIERAVILSDDEVIHAYNLPPSLQTPKESGTGFGVGLEEKVRAVEYEMIVEALKNSNGNIGTAAQELGLTRRMLGVRMEKYGINYKNFRSAGYKPKDGEPGRRQPEKVSAGYR